MSIKTLCFAMVVLFLPFLSEGQSLARQVIGNAGGFEQGANIQLNWTLGEAAVAHRHASSGKSSLTEGFQQPWVRTWSGAEALEVQIAPNPVSTLLNIYIPGQMTGAWTATLSDARGKVLLRRTGLNTGNAELDLQAYPAGMYFLTVYQESGDAERQTIKVVKI
jgi:hypothetical protein